MQILDHSTDKGGRWGEERGDFAWVHRCAGSRGSSWSPHGRQMIFLLWCCFAQTVCNLCIRQTLFSLSSEWIRMKPCAADIKITHRADTRNEKRLLPIRVQYLQCAVAEAVLLPSPLLPSFPPFVPIVVPSSESAMQRLPDSRTQVVLTFAASPKREEKASTLGVIYSTPQLCLNVFPFLFPCDRK